MPWSTELIRYVDLEGSWDLLSECTIGEIVYAAQRSGINLLDLLSRFEQRGRNEIGHRDVERST